MNWIIGTLILCLKSCKIAIEPLGTLQLQGRTFCNLVFVGCQNSWVFSWVVWLKQFTFKTSSFIATTSLFLAVHPSRNLHHLVCFGFIAEKHAMRYDGCGVCDLSGFAIENIFPASNHQEGCCRGQTLFRCFPCWLWGNPLENLARNALKHRARCAIWIHLNFESGTLW